MTDKNIGDRVRQFRILLGYSQEIFGEAIDMSHGQVSKVELNRSQPSNKFLNGMKLRFGANPDWIMTGEGEMYIAPEDYIHQGMELLGAQKMSEGFFKALKEPRFAEFQSYILMDNLEDEMLDDELKELVHHVLQLWQQGDERTRRTLLKFVRAFQDEKGKD